MGVLELVLDTPGARRARLGCTAAPSRRRPRTRRDRPQLVSPAGNCMYMYTAVPEVHAACRFASLQKVGRKMLACSHISSQRKTLQVHVFSNAASVEPFRTSAQDRTATRTEADLRAAQMLQPTNGQRHARRNLGDTAAGWTCSQNAWRRLALVQELPNCVRQRYDLHWRCTLRLHALDSRCACAWTLVGQIRT